MLKEQIIQEEQYEFPYHHLVGFKPFNNRKTWYGSMTYAGYMLKVLALIKELDFASFMDIGCGDGKLLYELSKIYSGKILSGADYSEKAILFAQAFTYGSQVNFYTGDIKDIASTFDCITVIETLEHIPDSDMSQFLKSIDERLASGGTVIVSIPSVNVRLNEKHFRHYDAEMVRNVFPKYELVTLNFMVSNHSFYKLLVRVQGKLSSFALVRRVSFWIAEKFFFNATPKRGTHIVASFKKL